MKIIIVGTAFPLRGAMAQLNAILANYLSKDHDVEIFSFKRQYPELLFPGKTQMDTSDNDILNKDIPNTNIIDSINPLNWQKTAKMIAAKEPNLIILRFWIPFFAPAFYRICSYVKKKTGAKILFICDNVIPHEKRPGDNFLIKLIFKVGDYFIIHSKSVEEDLKKFIKGKPYKYTPHPIYNIFGDPISKEEAVKNINKDFNIDLIGKKVILFFGYIRKYKGLKYLIDAMPEILKSIDVTLLIVGEFYEDEKITHDHINSLGLEKNIHVVSDYIPNEKVRYFFCSSDVVVLPYIDATQSGITQIAYYYDKPVIATDVGGLSEAVHDGETGFLIKPKDPKSVAKAVIKFYKEDLENKFSENAKDEKKKYEWGRMTEAIEELYGK
ncbi:MAG TPA: glycosyltransferase [Ignavibacteria bacterium]|nr:glycosyltransferase [Ignavibacteria bacterium]HQY51724.1 glycosyltransferase [Ignavibacteria bacterium]HRA99529.1 glycosyltransferase [Ignavibacteria bacterium]